VVDTTPPPDDPFDVGVGAPTPGDARATPVVDFEDPWMRSAAVPDPPADERGIRAIWLVLVSALVGAVAAIGAMQLFDDGPAPIEAVVDRVETQIVTVDGTFTPAAAVAARVLPSIVTVEVGALDDAGDFVSGSSGSGVVLDADGTVVTNEHVVGGAQEVRAVFADGRTYDAEIIGTDSLTDLAVIRIDAVGLTPIEIGSSTDMGIGDTAIAVGSPLGLSGGPSVTAGVLSAFGRRVQVSNGDELFGMIQTDAPITRGSSGGALVDDQGRLIGITSAIGVSDVGAEGLGFAIPVEMMTRITRDILEFGEARHAFLGITGATNFERADDGALAPAGVTIASIVPQTAAAASGLRVGDVILSFDGDSVDTMDQLVVSLRFYRVGDTVTLEIDRGGDAIVVDLQLQERPEGV
jgi:S1-C subfamily serine protease